MVYEDENGYLRDDADGRLIHRKIAYEIHYKNKKSIYQLPFSKYVVHHKDGNKKNNQYSNLVIMSQKKHYQRHMLEERWGMKYDTVYFLMKWFLTVLSISLLYSLFFDEYYKELFVVIFSLIVFYETYKFWEYDYKYD